MLHKDGVVYVSSVRKVLADLKPGASVLPRLSKGTEDMFLHADAAAWMDVKKAGNLLESSGLDLGHMGGFFFPLEALTDEDNPLGKVVHWFRMTRAGVLTSAEQWAFAVTLRPEGPVLEARGAYAPGSPMTKALTGMKSAAGPLTAGLPDKPFIFAYGIRKDLFSTPAELKKKAVAAIVEGNALDPATAEMKKQVGEMILAVHGEVTEVQHWAGQTKEDGPVAIATVVRCRNAEALKKIVKDNVPAIQTVLNHAFGFLDKGEEERFTLTFEEANEPAEGQVRADTILVSHPMLDKMLQEERDETRKMLLRIFPGETKVRARLAVADEKTLVVTIGGGRKFLSDAVAAAKASASKLEQGEEAKAALALLPANRFGVAMFSMTSAAGFYGSAMLAMSGGGGGMGAGAQIHFRAAPPVAMAMSADKGELVLTAHIPAAMIKRMIGTIAGGEDVEEDEEDAIPAGYQTPGAGRGDVIRVRKKVQVENVPLPAPAPVPAPADE
jgi:predicted LPLAT superfamily acyltransferase